MTGSNEPGQRAVATRYLLLWVTAPPADVAGRTYSGQELHGETTRSVSPYVRSLATCQPGGELRSAGSPRAARPRRSLPVRASRVVETHAEHVGHLAACSCRTAGRGTRGRTGPRVADLAREERSCRRRDPRHLAPVGEAGRGEVRRGSRRRRRGRRRRTPRARRPATAPRCRGRRCRRTGRARSRRRPRRRATRTAPPSRGRSSGRAPFGATRRSPPAVPAITRSPCAMLRRRSAPGTASSRKSRKSASGRAGISPTTSTRPRSARTSPGSGPCTPGRGSSMYAAHARGTMPW